MTLKDPKTIVRNLYTKYAKKSDNITYAGKLFIINTVINYLFKDKSYKEIDQFKVAQYGEIINKYLNNEVDIFWEEGILMIKDLESGELFRGG